jgi:biotin transport system substrate-specific component
MNDAQTQSPASMQTQLLSGWKGACIMTGVTAICAQISFHIPPTPVPVVTTVFAVLLSGLVLGARWGMVSQLQYLALGLLGAPVFALGKFGLPVLLGTTGGYLIAYPFVAWLVGRWSEKSHKAETLQAQLKQKGIACVVGLGVLYTIGCTWFAIATKSTAIVSLIMGMAWFVLFDLVKAALAVALSQSRR